MLILTRKAKQIIVINNEITITVLSGQNGQFKVGIQAPKNIPIHREEVQKRIQKEVQ